MEGEQVVVKLEPQVPVEPPENQIDITWKNRPQFWDTAIAKLINSDHLSDCQVRCEDEKRGFRAHRLILSLGSTYFAEKFKKPPLPGQEAVVRIEKGIKFKDVNNCMIFIYAGHIRLTLQDASDFLTVAPKLGIKDIQQAHHRVVKDGFNFVFPKAEPDTEDAPVTYDATGRKREYAVIPGEEPVHDVTRFGRKKTSTFKGAEYEKEVKEQAKTTRSGRRINTQAKKFEVIEKQPPVKRTRKALENPPEAKRTRFVHEMADCNDELLNEPGQLNDFQMIRGNGSGPSYAFQKALGLKPIEPGPSNAFQMIRDEKRTQKTLENPSAPKRIRFAHEMTGMMANEPGPSPAYQKVRANEPGPSNAFQMIRVVKANEPGPSHAFQKVRVVKRPQKTLENPPVAKRIRFAHEMVDSADNMANEPGPSNAFQKARGKADKSKYGDMMTDDNKENDPNAANAIQKARDDDGLSEGENLEDIPMLIDDDAAGSSNGRRKTTRSGRKATTYKFEDDDEKKISKPARRRRKKFNLNAPFKCKFNCGTGANTKSANSNHQRYCLLNPNRKISKCKICHMLLPPGSITYHMKRVHGHIPKKQKRSTKVKQVKRSTKGKKQGKKVQEGSLVLKEAETLPVLEIAQESPVLQVVEAQPVLELNEAQPVLEIAQAPQALVLNEQHMVRLQEISGQVYENRLLFLADIAEMVDERPKEEKKSPQKIDPEEIIKEDQ